MYLMWCQPGSEPLRFRAVASKVFRDVYIKFLCINWIQFSLFSNSCPPTSSQNHRFVDGKTFDVSCKHITQMKPVSCSSSMSSASSPRGLTSCCAHRKRTFNISNSKITTGLQGSIQELSTIQIRERPLTSRYITSHLRCFQLVIQKVLMAIKSVMMFYVQTTNGFEVLEFQNTEVLR